MRLEEAEIALMRSYHHRLNILNEFHKKVSIGIAYNTSNLVLVQQFEGEYMSFNRLPSIENSFISFSGKALENHPIDVITIFYDPLPEPLTPGQLWRSYSYDMGQPVAAIMRSSGQATVTWCQYPDPHSFDKTRPAWSDAPTSPLECPKESATIPTLVVPGSYRWLLGEFEVNADISSLLEQYGPGVYTLRIWSAERSLSSYSIFSRDPSP